MDKERRNILALLCFFSWLFFAYFYLDLPRTIIRAPVGITITQSKQESSFVKKNIDSCDGRYIYVHDLPERFNEAILKDCNNMYYLLDLCIQLENRGFGPELNDSEGAYSKTGWYDTNQFSLEVIFNHRMKQYDCLTRNSSLAAAFYVPFYGGFDYARYMDYLRDIKVRDALSLELVDRLKNTPEWNIMGGKDHFLVLGRMTWEFRRGSDNVTANGNKLLVLPQVENMTTVMIESNPWDSNDFAIPYPTYFHPSKDAEVVSWQDRVRKLKREWLYSFAGGPRLWDPLSVRNPVFDQCKKSNVCEVYQCAHVGHVCSPAGVMRLFQNSNFCLQPPGDSPTRKSTFDAILAGCIPVFFHSGAAYVQSIWHLPKNHTKYSVFIWEKDILKKNVSIEEVLRQISPQRIEEMREEVIGLIPRIIYADPISKSRTFKDAFDVTVEAVIQRVNRLRRSNISAEEVVSYDWDAMNF